MAAGTSSISWPDLVLPPVTLAADSVTIIARLTRSMMLETLGQDYIRTARAKGVVERGVVLRHGLANALIPIVTVVGVQAGYRLGGPIPRRSSRASRGA